MFHVQLVLQIITHEITYFDHDIVLDVSIVFILLHFHFIVRCFEIIFSELDHNGTNPQNVKYMYIVIRKVSYLMLVHTQ